MATEADVLESVIAKTAQLLEGVRTEHLPLPTPCPDYDVAQLVDHLVGWLRLFAARAGGEAFDEDPDAYMSEGEPAAEFAEAGERAVAAFRAGAAERSFPLSGDSPTPGTMARSIMIGEYVGHGWDLAIATAQPVPFTDEEAEVALAGLRGILLPEYRGPDKTFGPEVPAPADATGVERFVAFIGRDPRASFEPVQEDVYE